MVKASIHSIWMSWIPRRCRNQSSIYWYLTFQQKKLERNERTFLLPLWQRYSTLLLMLNRSAMFTKKCLLSFFPPHIICQGPSHSLHGTPKYPEIMSSETNHDFFHNPVCTTNETTTLSHDSWPHPLHAMLLWGVGKRHRNEWNHQLPQRGS